MPDRFDQMQKDITEIKTALRGFNGSRGLLEAFEDHCEQYNTLVKDFYNFKRICYTVFGVLVGSGILGTITWRVIEATN